MDQGLTPLPLPLLEKVHKKLFLSRELPLRTLRHNMIKSFITLLCNIKTIYILIYFIILSNIWYAIQFVMLTILTIQQNDLVCPINKKQEQIGYLTLIKHKIMIILIK